MKTSARLYRSGIKMEVVRLLVQNNDDMILEEQMNHDRVEVAFQKALNLMYHSSFSGLILYPEIDKTEYETIIREFINHNLCRILTY